jgi:hypothetical protein
MHYLFSTPVPVIFSEEKIILLKTSLKRSTKKCI